jgi:soluble cytochrome b562
MKILTIFIAALVITLILNGPIQSYADPQLDTLVNIATHARNNLNLSISKISNVPDDIVSLYKKGSDETDALTVAVNTQNMVSAKQHFLAAMNFFKTTNDRLNSLNATETNDSQRVTIIQLQSEITRLEKVAETLQTIAITNHLDLNLTQFNTSLNNAKQDLDAGKIEEASQLLATANRLIIDAHHSLSEIAQQRTVNRAKDFTEKQIERFDKIQDLNVTQNTIISTSNITAPKTISNLTSLENPEQMISKLKKLVSEGNVDEALKVIKSLDAYQKKISKNNETRLESPLQTSDNIQNDTKTIPTLPNTNSSNVTTTNPVKTNFTHNENFGQPHKDRKIDKTNSFQNNNFNQHGKDNKTESQVIPQGSFNSAHQDKTHKKKNHEEILKQNQD